MIVHRKRSILIVASLTGKRKPRDQLNSKSLFGWAFQMKLFHILKNIRVFYKEKSQNDLWLGFKMYKCNVFPLPEVFSGNTAKCGNKKESCSQMWWCTCNPSPWETEAGGSLKVQGQPGLHNKVSLNYIVNLVFKKKKACICVCLRGEGGIMK